MLLSSQNPLYLMAQERRPVVVVEFLAVTVVVVEAQGQLAVRVL